MRILLLLLAAGMMWLIEDGTIMTMLAVGLVLYLVSFAVLIGLTTDKIQLKIKAAPDAGNRNLIRGVMKLSNQSRLPVLSAKVKIEMENIITGEISRIDWRGALPPKRQEEITVTVEEALCGGIRVGVHTVIISDFFGLINKSIKLDHEVLTYVFPAVQEVPVSKEEISKYDMESQKFSPYQKGNDSSETFGIDTYQPGDRIKSIHWKLSGKMDQLVIRQLGLPVNNKLMILVDKSMQQELTAQQRSASTELAASLSHTFVKAGIQHQIGWYNQRRKEFECFQVRESADVWAFLPALLTSPYDRDIGSVTVKFLESEREKEFSHFVIVTNGETDVERLMVYGEVHTYRPEEFKQA